MHAQAGLRVTFAQRRVVAVPNHLSTARKNQDRLMGHARARAPFPAVAGHPNHFSLEARASEHAIGEHLRVVHCAMVEVQPQAADRAQHLTHRRQARFEHGQERVEAAPGVFVSELTRRAFALLLPGSALAAGVERRIQVRQIEASGEFGLASRIEFGEDL